MLDRVGALPPPKRSAHFQEAQTAESPVQTHQDRLETKSHGLWTGATHLSKQPEDSLHPGAGDREWKPAAPMRAAAAGEGGRGGWAAQPLPKLTGYPLVSGANTKAPHCKGRKLEASPQPHWLTEAAGPIPTVCTSGEDH